MYGLGNGELNLLNCESIMLCKFFEEEHLILAQLDDGNKYDTMKDTFRYKNKGGELMLVASILKDKDVNEYYLVL